MKNYVQDDENIPLTAPAGGVVSGFAYLIGAIFGTGTVAGADGAGAAAGAGSAVWAAAETVAIRASRRADGFMVTTRQEVARKFPGSRYYFAATCCPADALAPC